MSAAWRWSWLRIFNVVVITAAVASGGLTVVRDFMLIGGHITPVPEASYWAWLRISAFVAFVIAWVQENRRVRKLEARLSPSIRILPEAVEQPFTVDGRRAVSYWTKVKNDSRGQTVDGVEVSLTEISPSVISWVPFLLRIKHDNVAPFKRSFSLNPLAIQQIDLVSAIQGSPRIDIQHNIGPGPLVNVPAGRYRFTVTASGKDIPPATARFEMWMDDSGYLRCIAL